MGVDCIVVGVRVVSWWQLQQRWVLQRVGSPRGVAGAWMYDPLEGSELARQLPRSFLTAASLVWVGISVVHVPRQACRGVWGGLGGLGTGPRMAWDPPPTWWRVGDLVSVHVGVPMAPS